LKVEGARWGSSDIPKGRRVVKKSKFSGGEEGDLLVEAEKKEGKLEGKHTLAHSVTRSEEAL